MADSLVSSLIDRSGDPAAVAWAHEGVGDLARLADPQRAIEAALALGNGAVLQAASQGNLPKELRKAAGAALHKLKSRGVKVADVAPRTASIGVAVADLPPRAFLSLPDRDGDLEVGLTASNAEGNCVCAAMMGGPRRIGEMRHGHCNRSELRTVWREMEARPDLREVPFVVGLHLMDRVASGHDWAHFVAHVDPATLRAARMLDPMRGAPAPIDEDDAAIGRDWIVPRRFFDPTAATEMGSVLAHRMGPDEQMRAELLEAAGNLADRAIAAGMREALLEHLETVAVVFRWFGRERSAERALAQRRALEEGGDVRGIPPILEGARIAIMASLIDYAQEMMEVAGHFQGAAGEHVHTHDHDHDHHHDHGDAGER